MDGEENNDLLFLSLNCIMCSSEVVQLVVLDQTSFLCKPLSNWSYLVQLEAQDGFISVLFVSPPHVCGSRLCFHKLSQVKMPESTCGWVRVGLRDRKQLVKAGKT